LFTFPRLSEILPRCRILSYLGISLPRVAKHTTKVRQPTFNSPAMNFLLSIETNLMAMLFQKRPRYAVAAVLREPALAVPCVARCSTLGRAPVPMAATYVPCFFTSLTFYKHRYAHVLTIPPGRNTRVAGDLFLGLDGPRRDPPSRSLSLPH